MGPTHLGCLTRALAVVDGGGGGFRRWGSLAFVSAGDVAGVPCPFGAQRGRGGGWVGLLTWVVSNAGACGLRRWGFAGVRQRR